MPTIITVGSSKHAARKAVVTCRVIATCRDPENSSGLQQLRQQHQDALDVVKLDVTAEASIQAKVVCFR